MNRKISVIIPAHQEEKQIAQALESCVNQSFKDFEVIAVLNGCTDNTEEVAKAFQSKLDLNIIKTEKIGIGYACNLGFEHSNGRAIVVLEADSAFSENSLERIAQSVEQGFIGGTLRMKTKERKAIYSLGTRLHSFGRGLGWGPLRYCTADVYREVHGHREDADFGVDADFARKVKACGKTDFISDSYYLTSMRRFEKLGYREMLKQSSEYIKYGLLKKDWPKKEHAVIR
jgi:glycosyltransferase involved in cell wall biosynthesis